MRACYRHAAEYFNIAIFLLSFVCLSFAKKFVQDSLKGNPGYLDTNHYNYNNIFVIIFLPYITRVQKWIDWAHNGINYSKFFLLYGTSWRLLEIFFKRNLLLIRLMKYPICIIYRIAIAHSSTSTANKMTFIMSCHLGITGGILEAMLSNRGATENCNVMLETGILQLLIKLFEFLHTSKQLNSTVHQSSFLLHLAGIIRYTAVYFIFPLDELFTYINILGLLEQS